jgi:recombinational DNA repair ATPase RecF
MRIINFQLKDKEYKNLDIDLQNNKSGVIAFIGNNGSGKSNILESLSIIFYYLYNRKDKEIPFNFSITYTININLRT